MDKSSKQFLICSTTLQLFPTFELDEEAVERARSHRRGRGATGGGAEPQEGARSHRGGRGATEV